MTARRDFATYATTSTGHIQSSADWLDLHFAACRETYEAMARAVGIAPGWRVLDAGCGSGAYLPTLVELVGPTGALAALDLAPENIAAVEGRLATAPLACPVEARVGAIAALPYPDDHFDAVWCAAVSMYLGDDELSVALAEFRRVTRPGGLIALKEWESTIIFCQPADPALYARTMAANYATRHPVRANYHGGVRTFNLRRWLERAGLDDPWQRTYLADLWAPLRPIERQYLDSLWSHVPSIADVTGNTPEDIAYWHRHFGDPDAPDYLPAHPDFHHREGHTLAVGRVPGGGRGDRCRAPGRP